MLTFYFKGFGGELGESQPCQPSESSEQLRVAVVINLEVDQDLEVALNQVC